MEPAERRFRTKWGMLTGSEWIEARYREQLNKWLTPEALHYIYTWTPFCDANGEQVHDLEFLRLLHQDKDEAWAQLRREEVAFRLELAQMRRRRQEQEAAELAAESCSGSQPQLQQLQLI